MYTVICMPKINWLNSEHTSFLACLFKNSSYNIFVYRLVMHLHIKRMNTFGKWL